MRDVLAIEYGERFTSNEVVFPAFYCEDLIVFGIQNDIPEAVRLGEHMMSVNGYKMNSEDLQRAVKSYILDHADSYRRAMKKTTGPIDNASLYRTVT